MIQNRRKMFQRCIECLCTTTHKRRLIESTSPPRGRFVLKFLYTTNAGYVNAASGCISYSARVTKTFPIYPRCCVYTRTSIEREQEKKKSQEKTHYYQTPKLFFLFMFECSDAAELSFFDGVYSIVSSLQSVCYTKRRRRRGPAYHHTYIQCRNQYTYTTPATIFIQQQHDVLHVYELVVLFFFFLFESFFFFPP